MSIWHYKNVKIEQLQSRNVNTLFTLIGIEIIEIGDDFLKGRMPIDARTIQPHGIMHGGASCVLAESLGSIAANLVLDTSLSHCVGMEINTSHVRPAISGWVIGTAKPLHIGKTTQLWEIPIVNEQGQLVSMNRLRMAVIDRQKPKAN